MTKAYIVTKEITDIDIIRALLDDTLLEDVKFVNGVSQYGAESMARSLLLERRSPVLLIIDADTNDPDAIAAYHQDLEFLTRKVATGTPFKILQAVPTIEAIFLQDRTLFEQLINRQLTDLEWQLGQKDPKGLLDQLPEGTLHFIQSTLSQLTEPMRQTFLQHPLIQEISTFLQTQAEASEKITATRQIS